MVGLLPGLRDLEGLAMSNLNITSPGPWHELWTLTATRGSDVVRLERHTTEEAHWHTMALRNLGYTVKVREWPTVAALQSDT